MAKVSRAMSKAAKLQLEHSIRYSRPVFSSPSGITLVLIDKTSPEHGAGAAKSEGAKVRSCRVLDRSVKGKFL